MFAKCSIHGTREGILFRANIFRRYDYFAPLLLFLMCTNAICATKIEDVSICTNDTNCDESVDSVLYSQSSEFDDSTLEKPSNDTGEDNPYIMTVSTEITMYSKTDLNVTEQPDLQSTVTTVSPTVTMSPNDETLTLEAREICECNLMKSACDINCCCDVDCNQFQLSVFSHCQDHHHAELYDSRYCYNRNFIQRNNTPFILEKLANNLFCILYDNLPSAYNVDNYLILKNEEDLWKAIRTKKYQWKIENGELLPKYNLSKYYRHGDILWKLDDKSIEPIELLQSGFSGICSFKKILRYLEDWKNTCIQNKLTNDNRYLFPETFNNFTIISSLPLFNETFITQQTCRSNVCLPITTHYCTNSFSVCNETEIPTGFCTNFSCTNIVKGVKYTIGHNGSAGVNSIDAYFNIGNASHTFHQYFEIRYEWANANKTKIFARSGNPGYVAGKPIITGVSRANGSDEILFNRTDGFLTLPLATKNGECGRVDRHVVTFRDDIKLRCSVKLYVKNFTSLSCAQLQNLTMNLLTGDLLSNVSQRYVSKLGNFTSKNTADWSRIVFDRMPQSVVTARTVGKRILCSGLITAMHLNILHSVLPKPKTLTNYKILGIGVTFGKEEDVSWSKCTSKNCTDLLDIDIVSYVNFHDVTKPFKYYFVGGPNLDLTLPYDFFYPFLNSSKGIEALNISFLLFTYITLYIIIYI